MHVASLHDVTPEPATRHSRKQRVLTHGTPSVTRTIADALVLKDGDLFLVTESDGRVPAGPDHGLGLYYHDCRYLRTYELLIDDTLPVGLGAGTAAGYRASVQLTNPELRRSGGADVPRDTLGIEWTRTLDGHGLALRDEIRFRNWGHTPMCLRVELRFAAAFEDVFQIRGLLGEQLGRQEPPEWHEGALRFLYHGKDGVDRRLDVTLPLDLSPASAAAAAGTIRLAPREEHRLSLELAVHEGERRGAGERSRTVPERPASAAVPSGASPTDPPSGAQARLTSDSLALNEMLERSFADLHLLRSSLRERSFIAAGIPWFATLFGRDSLVAALQLLPYSPAIAADTLRLLASFQGDRVDDWRDESPGKILHELRVGEMARAGEIPHSCYYGSVDATPLFLIVLARYVAWTGDLALFDELAAPVRRALEWIDRYGDGDGDGYVEYRSASEHGLINQGWKDSGDAIVDEHGRIAKPPIALVEVQGYVYAAKLGVAELYRRRGDDATALRLEQEAADLRTRFNRDYWVESIGCYAMALEAGKEPLRVISSNPGHALWCGIADADKARRVAERLMASDMFTGWGVRTLSDQAAAYNPIGYHLGTVWPHDNAFVAAGFRRYGLDAEARRIADGLASAAMGFEHDRLPELFTGFSREGYGAPIRYPVACHPQAWAAGALPFLVSRLLGLDPAALDRRLRIVRPILPSFVALLELEGVRVGAGTAHIRFRRDGVAGAPVTVEVLAVEGDLDVRVE
jgi:glycogen debranching enzyme